MMLRIILVVFAVIAIADCYKPFTSYLEQLTHDEWLAFKFQHGKTYATEFEEMLRLKTFMQNKEKIAKHNQKYEKRLVSFKLGLNKYADLTHSEFTNIMNGFNRSVERLQDEIENFERRLFMSPANVDIKKSVDWRELGAVTEVKDQGHCGSCWAFSTTGALEGQHFRKNKFLVSLSEQNLVDCSGKFGNNGCDGGLMDNAFRYIKANGGIDTEKSYPYEGIVDACHFKKSAVGATDKGFVDIPEGDEEKLMEAVATVGPLSVAIDASHESFQFYNDGVYFEPKCDSQELDHGVLVVGYGTDKRTGADYWLVKNSWGTTWGDQGYIKMARNKANHCGIATTASYPVV